MKEREYPFKIGQRVKVISTGTSIGRHQLSNGQILNTGVRNGDIVIITDIVFEGGSADIDDPRYCGDNFNVRGEDLEAIVEAVPNKNSTPEERLEYATILNKPKELTPLEICNQKFKPGDHITSAEGTIGMIGEGDFYNGGSGTIFSGTNRLSLYSKTRDVYATVIETDVSSVNRDVKWLDTFEKHMLNDCSVNTLKPIVKSPEQVKHENWLHSVHAMGMIPVGHSDWDQMNLSKRQLHNNSDQLISPGLAMMLKPLTPNECYLPKENKIIIPNEPIEIFIKKSKFVN